jgi:polyisoprenoid-binding protein YceI
MHVSSTTRSRTRLRPLACSAGVLALTLSLVLAPGAEAKKKSPKKSGATSTVATATKGTGSEAGYRVKEEFLAPPAKVEAVGRTSDVTGTVTIAKSGSGLAAKDIKMKVLLANLKSDQARRDGAIKDRGLETNKFPETTFESTGEIAVPADGKDTSGKVKGKLTLHGVTKDVEIPIQAGLRNGKIEVVGALEITMADYKIDPPSIGGFVSVGDKGSIEFKLVLARG